MVQVRPFLDFFAHKTFLYKYNVGEEVLIKERFMGKKIKSKRDQRIHKGVVVEKKGDRYVPL